MRNNGVVAQIFGWTGCPRSWVRVAIELPVGGRLGPGITDSKEAAVLNRVVRWTDEGLEYEADPRQAEKLLESLGLDDGCNGAATPGQKPLLEQLEKDRPVPESAQTNSGSSRRAAIICRPTVSIFSFQPRRSAAL